MSDTDLSWHRSNIASTLLPDLTSATQELLLISPYVKTAPLRQITTNILSGCGMTLITDLDLHAMASGSSDIDALIAVASLPGGTVRGVQCLHAKIYCRDWTSWWVGSANFTNAGLGLSTFPNVEIMACVADPGEELLRAVTYIVHRSIEVPLHFLETIRVEVETLATGLSEERDNANGATAQVWERLHAQSRAGRFMLQELPLCPGPDILDSVQIGSEWHARHDRALFGIVESDGPEGAREKIAAGLLKIPVVEALDQYISQPRRFGEITAWLHDRCEDRPVPYRSEIKELTARLLTWLLTVYPDRYRRSRPRHSEIFVRITGSRS